MQRECECGASSGFSGRCGSCDRTSLTPRFTADGGNAPFAAARGSAGSRVIPDLSRVATEAAVPAAQSRLLSFPRAPIPGPGPARPPVRQAAPAGVQTQLRVSAPGDAAEQEAHAMGQLIARMAEPEAPVAPVLATPGRNVFRHGAGEPTVTPDLWDQLEQSRSSGAALPNNVRHFMEPRFGTDFSNVRIHTGEHAASLSGQLSARAFTVGRDIYFGRDQFQPGSAPGRELIAHELTHTIQQGGARMAAPAPASMPPPAVTRAAPAAPAPPPLATRAATPMTPPVVARTPVAVQRWGVGDALGFFADQANNIPGFRMLTIVLGVNPINMSRVDPSPVNILKALIEFMPGGGLIVQALQNSGILDKVAAWVSQQIATLAMTGAALKDALNTFLSSLKLTDALDPGGVWARAKRIFTEPIDRLIGFAKGLVTGILGFIKDAILLPLAKLAQGTRGWDLLIAVLGKNPITGEIVTPSAEALIGGFLKLIGQDEIFENMKKSGALGRAWTWFQGTVKTLVAFVSQIPELFMAALKSLTIEDVVLVAGAFQKVASVFGGFLSKFTDWAGTAMWTLLEIIFDVVSPGALSYVKKTGNALKEILKNPLPFLGNLVKAAKLGFSNFADNIGTHLKTGLIEWLTGALTGVYIPTAFTLVEVGKFALSVLGITWGQIRGKIVKALGPSGETIMKGLETTFDVVVALVKGGPAAAWEVIKDKLTNLKDMVIDGIVGFVTDTIVKKAIPKLIGMFIPGAGFIPAIISIYDTIMVFVNKLAKIAAAVKAFVDSIVAIAAGQIAGAAAKVESTLAGLLSLAISFLAGFLGLSGIASKVMAVIEKVRATVDKALDTAITWIVTKAKALFAGAVGKAKAVAGKLFGWGATKSTFTDDTGATHTVSVQADAGPAHLIIASTPMPVEQFLKVFLADKSPDYLKANNDKIVAVRTAIADSAKLVTEIDTGIKAGKDEAALTPLQQALLNKNVALSTALSALVGKNPLTAKAREHYMLEGITGTFGSIPKPTGDDLTADHQPQAAVLQAADSFGYFDKTGKLTERAAGRAKEGYAINLSTTRHKAGETFGSKGKVTKSDFLARVQSKVAPDMDPLRQRRVVISEIKTDLDRDAAAIVNVVNAKPDSSNWADVLPGGKPTEREPVIQEIKTRIIAGEAQIKAQDLASLAN